MFIIWTETISQISECAAQVTLSLSSTRVNRLLLIRERLPGPPDDWYQSTCVLPAAPGNRDHFPTYNTLKYCYEQFRKRTKTFTFKIYFYVTSRSYFAQHYVHRIIHVQYTNKTCQIKTQNTLITRGCQLLPNPSCALLPFQPPPDPPPSQSPSL